MCDHAADIAMNDRTLTALISRHAKTFSESLRAAAERARTEEDVRIAAASLLAFVEREAGISLDAKHEFTIAKGRADSVYERVIIEYKNPSDPSTRLAPTSDGAPTRKVVEQLKQRFLGMQRELGHPLASMFGVATDGKSIVFLRHVRGEWREEPPVPVSRMSCERWLWALFNLGRRGRAYTAANLAEDFGAGAPTAKFGVRSLYQTLTAAKTAKARILFKQWRILFGEVCGYDVNVPSAKIAALAEAYEVEGSGVDSGRLLFAVHTYYALFMKLLASEIVVFYHRLPSRLERMAAATNSAKLRRELEDIEAGSIFRHFNITNFLEGDLFTWYLSEWSDSVETIVRAMVARLDDYNPGTLSEHDDDNRDLLKNLYEALFPKTVRHDLGEYYTPDWLATYLLDEVGYNGDPTQRLLDPACGSGTFVVLAISRVLRWFDENRERCDYDEPTLCRLILKNIVGFDLNPLAVMAARTNYLIAIRDLLGHIDRVELPIYLCDSVMTPSEYSELNARGLGLAKELTTAAGPFVIPNEVTNSLESLNLYTDQLELAIANGFSFEDFVSRCVQEGLRLNEAELHARLFDAILALARTGENGVWARIIRNAFAPLFVGRFDYIVGNPPWVNWDSLPEEYRKATAPLWQKYNLFRHKGYKAKLGSAKDDISILLTYVAVDEYLRDGGRLGFVITQTVFKTKGGGEGFRSFRYATQGRPEFTYISPIVVHDLSAIKPFEGASNRTALFIAQKSDVPFTYPVPYVVWQRTKRLPRGSADLPAVLAGTARTRVAAAPVGDSSSPWITAPSGVLPAIRKILGPADYRAYAGSCTWLNGVYWVEMVDDGERTAVIANMGDVGKIKVESVTARVERDLLYPLLRGRDVQRWSARAGVYLILANRTDKLGGIPEAEMKRLHPLTFAYFRRFEALLRQRSGYRQFFSEGDPYYSIYNVGPYSMAPWKVVWPEVAERVEAAVCGPDPDGRPVMADHTVISVPCSSDDEAFFVAGMLNSLPARVAAEAYIVMHPSPHVLQHIAVPRFEPNNPAHQKVSHCARECTAAVAADNVTRLRDVETELDTLAARLWSLPEADLDSLRLIYSG